MKEFWDKYYVFTLTFVGLIIAMFLFRKDTTTASIIVGCFAALANIPSAKQNTNHNTPQ